MFLRVSAICLFFSLAFPAWAASLDGSWTGGGFVQPKDGARERVRCRVSYSRLSERVYSVVARCATQSADIRQTGKILHVSGGRYVGDFYNPDFDIGGRVRVVVSGSRQTVTFSSSAGRGQMSLRKR